MKQWRKLAIARACGILIVAGGVYAYFYYIYDYKGNGIETNVVNRLAIDLALQPLANKKPFTLLVLGVDERDGDVVTSNN